MKNLLCVAIDDEPMALLIIEQYCRRKGSIDLFTYSEPHVGIAAIYEKKPDLVFLDIQMDSLNGLNIAHQLPSDLCIIFTTAHAQYAVEGFDLDAVDYLHKPFSYERFEIALGKVLRRMESRVPSAPTVLVVKEEYDHVTIPVAAICYIEALGNYVKICRDGQGHVLSRMNLKAISALLPSQAFVRIHRSFLIPLNRVERFTRNQVKLQGVDKWLPIGKSYVEEVMGMLQK